MAKSNLALCNQLKAMVANYLLYKQDYNITIYKNQNDALCFKLDYSLSTFSYDDMTNYIIFTPSYTSIESNASLTYAIINNLNHNDNKLSFDQANTIYWDFQQRRFYQQDCNSKHYLPQFLNQIILYITSLIDNYLFTNSTIEYLQSKLNHGKINKV